MGFDFRKMAGLLVELPPEEKDDELLPGSAPDAKRDQVDINELLAQQGLGPNARSVKSDSQSSAQAGPKSTVKSVEQIVRESDGPNLDEIKVASVPQPASGKSVEPKAIYDAAKLPSTPFSAEQMLDMMTGLPAELPLETKRQTVKVTLGALGKSVGATPETIVADASRKMAALAAYSDHLQKRTEEFAAKSETEIAALQKQIEEKKAAVLGARQTLAQSKKMCESESNRLDDVLEFFSLDVGPSRHAPDVAPDAKTN